MRCLMVAVALVACSSNRETPAPPAPPPPADASPDGITTIDDYDPASGMHLDDDGPNGRPANNRRPPRPSVPIGIMLRSSPVVATVFVDGENVGTTPKYWAGYADGKEHEFSFTRPDYRLARYRFVPVSSGTLHATLERLPGESASNDPVAPKLPPPPVAPPPTILTPPDAARAAPPPVDVAPAAPAAPAVDAAPVERAGDASVPATPIGPEQ